MNTRDKRASALACGLAFLTVLPLTDGVALDQGDRQQVAALYRGVLAGTPAPVFTLDICDTSVESLMPERTVVSLMPTRTVEHC